MDMKYLVTGAAGFIGNFVAERLCKMGHIVIGLDNLNDYYDPALKLARLKRIEHFDNFTFIKMDLADRSSIAELFKTEQFDRVIHLAAQAGVRYSIENPLAYIDSNVVGTATILEGCRHNKVKHLVYASSSSVYGANKKIPFAEEDRVDHPVSLYAATKKSNELMAHTYSHLYSLPTTGLRFFTVYGPWGRPDMAPFLFTDAIANDRTIKVFNNGKMQRDFTYIDDIVEGIIRIQDVIPNAPVDKAAVSSTQAGSTQEEAQTESSPFYKLYNIGNNQPVELETFISCIENALDKKALKEYLPMQDGDVVRTFADVSGLEKDIGFKPNTQLQDGINEFVDWFLKYKSNV
jgi:UDP-glucuronate 4-epimerase